MSYMSPLKFLHSDLRRPGYVYCHHIYMHHIYPLSDQAGQWLYIEPLRTQIEPIQTLLFKACT